MRARLLIGKIVKLIILCLVGLAATYFKQHHPAVAPAAAQVSSQADAARLTPPEIIKHAFENQLSNIQVTQAGRLLKVLRDDNYGPRHQRFLVQLSDGQVLLIAHNIDLAPKVEDLKPGETIAFCGEYEWNNKGGVIHWTHHDPHMKHADGWLLYNNRKYQ